MSKRRKEMICPERFTPPAMNLAEQLLSIGQPVSKNSLQYMPLNLKSLVLGGSSQCLVLDVLIYVDVMSNKQSIFSSQIRTPSFPINWPSLVSIASHAAVFRGARISYLLTK